MSQPSFRARGHPAILFLVIFATLSSVSTTRADNCTVVPSPINFGGLQEKDVTIYVKRDTPCTVTFGRVPFAYFQQKVTKRPRGIYGVANTIYGAYRPPDGYIGDDYFELQLIYRRLGLDQDRFRTVLRVTAKIGN